MESISVTDDREAVALPEKCELTVVVPVYNESRTLETVVDAVRETLREVPLSAEILVVNDGSSDWSAALEGRLLERDEVRVRSHRPNLGKGGALDRTFPTLESEFTVVIDADGEYAAEDIPDVLGPLVAGEADFVLGSRYGFGRRRPRQYLATWLVNRLINLWFRCLSGRRFRDVLSGLWAFRTELLRDARFRESRFSFCGELPWVVERRGGRWAEVPISYHFRNYAEGKKIRWWETGTILFALLRYRFARAPGGPQGVDSR